MQWVVKEVVKIGQVLNEFKCLKISFALAIMIKDSVNLGSSFIMPYSLVKA